MSTDPRPAEPWLDDAGVAGLRARTAHGVKWAILQTLGARAASLAVFLVLARLLAPQAFGLFAFAQAVVAVVGAITESGVDAAVVQRERVSRDFLDALFWAGLVGAGALTLAGVLGGGALACALGQPDLGPLLRVLSLGFVLAGLSAVQAGLLRRAFRFRADATRYLAGEGIGGVVAVAAALSGAGVWSLVAQRLVADAVASALLWTAAEWRPAWRFPVRALRGSAAYALDVTGLRLIWAVSVRVDDFLVGLFLGPVALGFYAVGYRVVRILNQIFTNAVIQVAFASFARVQSDRERLQRLLKSALRVGSLVGVPVFLWLMLTADTVVPVLFGARWLPSVGVMRVLAALGLVRSLQTHGESALVAAGRADLVMRVEVVRTLVMIGGILVFVNRGILWVAWVLVVTQYLASPVLAALVSRQTGVALRELAGQYLPALTAGAAMVLVSLAVRAPLAALPAAARLACESALAAGAYLGAAWLADREAVRAALRFAGATVRG